VDQEEGHDHVLTVLQPLVGEIHGSHTNVQDKKGLAPAVRRSYNTDHFCRVLCTPVATPLAPGRLWEYNVVCQLTLYPQGLAWLIRIDVRWLG
jgi:hypothetical protein